MKIYISHSRSFDFKSGLYQPLMNSPLAKEHEFILPHAEHEEPFEIKAALHSKSIDLIIAEVSFSSTGQGIELGWADIYEVPIVCIYKDGTVPSGSLSVVTKRMLMYTSTENMLEDITKLLQNYETNY
nr:Unknown Function [uncultured bacterium]